MNVLEVVGSGTTSWRRRHLPSERSQTRGRRDARTISAYPQFQAVSRLECRDTWHAKPCNDVWAQRHRKVVRDRRVSTLARHPWVALRLVLRRAVSPEGGYCSAGSERIYRGAVCGVDSAGRPAEVILCALC